MSPAIQELIATSAHSMHFTGKLDGHVLMLIETGNPQASHAVLLATPEVLHQLPTMPEDKARTAFWEMARRLSAAA